MISELLVLFGLFALFGVFVYFMMFYKGRLGVRNPGPAIEDIRSCLLILAVFGIFFVGIALWGYFYGSGRLTLLAFGASTFTGAFTAGYLHLRAHRRKELRSRLHG